VTQLRPQRKLAAILVADAVSYSKLMRADETATLALLNTIRHGTIDPRIVEYGGRPVKWVGDGLIAEFPSAVDAVQCAADIQRTIAALNREADPANRMEFRVGINFGDVIVENDDLFGDGVNVASRLEAIADPGGICLSGTVHDQVWDKLDLDFEERGLRELKNIADPVRIYAINLQSEGRRPDQRRPRRIVADAPSIAVLPFNNMSGDDSQDYFSDGITEDIITDLSKIPSLMVIARNSSFTYKGRAIDVKEVARDLGVRHVLEGSVRKAGTRVRVTAQLIDGRSGAHVWAERYDRVLEDIFAIQDEITMAIVGELKLRLDLDDKPPPRAAAAADMEAYDLVLRARELLGRVNRELFPEIVELLERAMAVDPRYVPARVCYAFAHIVAYANGWTERPDETLQRAFELALSAVEIDPKDPFARRALAVSYLWKRDMDAALDNIEQAVALNPSDSESLASRGSIFSFMHRPEAAIADIEKAMRLNPRFPDMWLHFLAHANFVAGRYAEAIRFLEERIRRQPQTDISRVLLAACYGHLDRLEDARRLWKEVLAINPTFSLEQKESVLPFKFREDWERFVEGLRKAGVAG
jgi:adenylate cyclase